MNYYRGTLKGYFVLGGIALMLATCLQQTHALCNFACCSDLEVSKLTATSSARPSGCRSCHNRQAELPSRAPQQEPGPNMPCGPECICAQVSDPAEAPRVTSEIVKSQVIASGAEIVLAEDAAVAPPGPTDIVSFEDLASVTASETCVRLCRFLT